MHKLGKLLIFQIKTIKILKIQKFQFENFMSAHLL